MVVHEGKLIGGNFSGADTVPAWWHGDPAHACAARGRRLPQSPAAKAFASMIAAADYVMVLAYPDESTSPSAGMLLVIRRRRPAVASTRCGTRSACGRPAAIR
jgi:hypothetical protein